MKTFFDSSLEPNLPPLPRWFPKPGLAAHPGIKLPAKPDFFHPPPAEIGELLSAYTDLDESTPDTIFFGLMPAGDVAVCSYVGVGGVAGYLVSLPRANPRIGGVLRFVDAKYLRVFWERTRFDGKLLGEVFIKLAWLDERGSTVFYFNGSTPIDDAPAVAGTGAMDAFANLIDAGQKAFNPGPGSFTRAFSEAATAAWTQHLLRGIDGQLAREGHIPFPIERGDAKELRLSRGQLEIVAKDRTDRWGTGDLANASADTTSLVLTHRSGARLQLEWNQLLNAQLFEQLAPRLFSPSIPARPRPW